MISGRIALSALSLLSCCSVSGLLACFHRLTLTAAVLGSDGTCAEALTQGCTEGSNLARASSVEKDSVLKSFLRCVFITSCCGYMLKVCVF